MIIITRAKRPNFGSTKKEKINMSHLTVKDGTKLFFNDLGTGKTVLMVHGWSIHSDSWEYMVGYLTRRGYRCITFDMRGCGRSDQPWEGYDFKTLAEDLYCIIEYLNLSDITLMGHSMGCGVICQYLADYGEDKVSQAVLISTMTPFVPLAEDNPNGIDKALFDTLVDIMRADRPLYVRNLADDFFALPAKSHRVSPAMVDWAINLTLQAAAHAAEKLYYTTFNGDFRNILTDINIPVLLLHGDKDMSAPLELTAYPSQRLLKNSELKIYEGQGHGFYISEATMLGEDVHAFILAQQNYALLEVMALS